MGGRLAGAPRRLTRTSRAGDVERGRKLHEEVALHAHFNHPREITAATRRAADLLTERGVYLRGPCQPPSREARYRIAPPTGSPLGTLAGTVASYVPSLSASRKAVTSAASAPRGARTPRSAGSGARSAARR